MVLSRSCCFSVLVLVYVLGSWLGSAYGRHQVLEERAKELQKLETYLSERVVGIEVGERFPDIVVWSNDETSAFRLTDLLPDGGFLFFISSDCPTCAKALRALTITLADLGTNAPPTVLLTGSHSDRLTNSLTDIELGLPLYRDVEESLHRTHKMILARAYFVLDSSGVLLAMGTMESNPSSFHKLFTSNPFPR